MLLNTPAHNMIQHNYPHQTTIIYNQDHIMIHNLLLMFRKTKINSTQNSINHDIEIGKFLINTSISLFNYLYQDQNKDETESVNALSITNDEIKALNTTSCSMIQLQRKYCQQGYAYYQKGNMCTKCNNPNKDLKYCSEKDFFICGYSKNPSIPPLKSIGVPQSKCRQQHFYDSTQQICYHCPDNFDLSVSKQEQSKHCYCTQPNVYKQVQGIKICQKQIQMQIIPVTCPFYNNVSEICIKCPQNQVMQWNNGTKRYKCSCQPPYKINIFEGNNKCQCNSKTCPKIQNDCPLGYSLCRQSGQCLINCQKNLELQFDSQQNTCLCYCNYPYRFKTSKSGAQTCQ